MSVILASVLALVSLVPQMARIHRTGQVAGLTMSWPVIAMVSNAGWTAYVLRQGLIESVWASASMVVVYVIIGGQLLVRRVPWRRAAAVGTAWAAVLGGLWVVDVITDSTLLGFVLALAFPVQVAPAIWAAWRDPAPTGLSAGTWAIVAIEVTLWGIYGAVNRDLPIVVFGILGVAACSAMLIRWWVTRAAVAAVMARVPQPA